MATEQSRRQSQANAETILNVGTRQRRFRPYDAILQSPKVSMLQSLNHR